MSKNNRRGSIVRYGEVYRAFVRPPSDKRYSRTFDSEYEADIWLTAELAKIDSGEYLKPTNKTFRTWAARWLKIYVEPSVRTNTVDNYHYLLDSYTGPIKNKLLSEILPVDIQEIYSNLSESGIAPSTLQRLHAVLRGLFKKAKGNELVRRNIMDDVSRPRAPLPEIKFLSPDEIQVFLEKSKGENIEIAVWIAAYTGMRLSEIRALSWDDVDLESGYISVRRSLYATKDGWELNDPKTKSGVRTLPIPTPLLNKLTEYKTTWKENPWNLILIGKHGRPIPTSSISLGMKRIREKTGYEITFHGLRHSLASMLVSANVGVTDVAAYLGHSDPTITLKRYSHAKKDSLKGTAEQINKIMSS